MARRPHEAAQRPAAATAVAAFDFDGTLTDGGSVYPFLVALRGRWVTAVARATARLLPAPCCGPRCWAAPRPTTAMRSAFFIRLLGGLPLAEVERRAAHFARQHLAHHVRPDTLERLRWHAAQGHHVIIVSASPEVYVIPAGEELGVEGVVATRLAVGGGGLLTGGYEGKNCRGAEKYARLVGHLRAHGLLSSNGEQPVLWAYGNSRGDLRLLKAARPRRRLPELGWVLFGSAAALSPASPSWAPVSSDG